MVVALMIPVPVAAKGGSGKLVKSVTVYSLQDSGRWQATRQTTYKYDKKNNPSEIGNTRYTSWFLGVPVNGSKTVSTVKYKYKGKLPKSAKIKDGAGKVVSTRKYKKGRVVSIASTKLTSEERYSYDAATDKEVFKGDEVSSSASNTSISYNKYGLATVVTETGNDATTPVAGMGTPTASNGTSVEACDVTHKKGVPSIIVSSFSRSGSNTDSDGTYSYQENADGTYTYVNNGVVTTGKDDVIYKNYSVFNGKGFVIENGQYKIDTKTGVQVPLPRERFDYVTKKGKVTQIVVYDLQTNDQGVVTKTTATTMYQFKYAKAKASKVRYLSMINAFAGTYGGEFFWF